jgi:hypothetical protein
MMSAHHAMEWDPGRSKQLLKDDDRKHEQEAHEIPIHH